MKALVENEAPSHRKAPDPYTNLMPDSKLEGSMIFIAEPELQFELRLEKSEFDKEVNDDVFLEELLLKSWLISFKPLTQRALIYNRLKSSYGEKFKQLVSQNKVRSDLYPCVVYSQIQVILNNYDEAEKCLITLDQELEDHNSSKKQLDDFEYRKYKYNINLWLAWLYLLKALNTSAIARIFNKRKGDSHLSECDKLSKDFNLLHFVVSLLLEVNSVAIGVLDSSSSRALEIRSRSHKMETFALFLKHTLFIDYGNEEQRKIGEKGLHDLSKMESVKFLSGIKLCSFYKTKGEWEGMVRVAVDVVRKAPNRVQLDRSQEEMIITYFLKGLVRARKEREARDLIGNIHPLGSSSQGLLLFYQYARFSLKYNIGAILTASHYLDHIKDNLSVDHDTAVIPFIRYWQSQVFQKYCYTMLVSQMYYEILPSFSQMPKKSKKASYMKKYIEISNTIRELIFEIDGIILDPDFRNKNFISDLVSSFGLDRRLERIKLVSPFLHDVFQYFLNKDSLDDFIDESEIPVEQRKTILQKYPEKIEAWFVYFHHMHTLQKNQNLEWRWIKDETFVPTLEHPFSLVKCLLTKLTLIRQGLDKYTYLEPRKLIEYIGKGFYRLQTWDDLLTVMQVKSYLRYDAFQAIELLNLAVSKSPEGAPTIFYYLLSKAYVKCLRFLKNNEPVIPNYLKQNYNPVDYQKCKSEIERALQSMKLSDSVVENYLRYFISKEDNDKLGLNGKAYYYQSELAQLRGEKHEVIFNAYKASYEYFELVNDFAFLTSEKRLISYQWYSDIKDNAELKDYL